MNRRLLAATALTAVALLVGGLTIPATFTLPTAKVPGADQAPGEGSLRARINPETGEVEVGVPPTARKLDAGTAEALRRDTDGLVPRMHPDGSVSVDLQGRFQSVAVARIGEDGRVHLSGCSDDTAQVEHALAGDRLPEVK